MIQRGAFKTDRPGNLADITLELVADMRNKQAVRRLLTFHPTLGGSKERHKLHLLHLGQGFSNRGHLVLRGTIRTAPAGEMFGDHSQVVITAGV